ncbi:hypothetical protein HJG60_015650 [Phyllostomus discolor]|uniref:Uncharacterized protein n=1 Tax=Phyllostomus discolor TaxID=89673 RepID=A0A833ZC10_9CHIR|nr:hypothetical protein HJG60_015650 [Phyllostomus discolor]
MCTGCAKTAAHWHEPSHNTGKTYMADCACGLVCGYTCTGKEDSHLKGRLSPPGAAQPDDRSLSEERNICLHYV